MAEEKYIPRMLTLYKSEVIPAMMQKFGYKNIMQVPRLEKIVLNMGLGDCKDNAKSLESAVADMATIAGQKPIVTRAIALPRVRDFRGVPSKSFDGRGNYAMGIKEQLIFPEIDYDSIDKIRGMDIIFVTTANTDEEAQELLRLLGMPFEQN